VAGAGVAPGNPGGSSESTSIVSLEHLASPETLPQARELFARRDDLEYGRSSASPTPKPGEESAETAGWQASHGVDAIVGRLTANLERVSSENLRRLAHQPEARIRAQARYAAFRAGISVEPSPRR
jgi:hypothetical protein